MVERADRMASSDALDPATLAQRRGAAGMTAFVATGAILIFAAATLAEIGVQKSVLTWILAAFSLVVPAVVAVCAPTVSRAIFAVAGRRVSVSANASAIALALFGGVFAVGLAAASFRSAAEAAALALGLCGGLALANLLVAPFVRRAAAASLGDFLAARFGGIAVAALAGLAATAAILPMLAAELQLAGQIGNWTLGIGKQTALFAAVLLMLGPPLIGGMRGVTLAGVLQFVLLLAALTLASVSLSAHVTDYSIPLAGYAEVAGKLATSVAAVDQPWRPAGLSLCIALGLAAAPALLLRAATTGSAQAARWSMSWALPFVALFAITVISMAGIAGAVIADATSGAVSADGLVQLQPWMAEWSGREGEPVKLCGVPALSPDVVAVACSGPVAQGDLAVDPDIALLAAPDIAGLSPLFAVLVASGVLAASLGAGSLLLLAAARAFAHDVLLRLLGRRIPVSRQLLVERLAMIAAAWLAWRLATTPLADYMPLALTSLSLSACGLLPALLAAVWWRRANRFGAAAGIVVGFAIAVLLAGATLYEPAILSWLEPAGLADLAKELGAERAALIAVPAGLLVIVLVSLATPAPGPRQRAIAKALQSSRDLPAEDA